MADEAFDLTREEVGCRMERQVDRLVGQGLLKLCPAQGSGSLGQERTQQGRCSAAVFRIKTRTSLEAEVNR